MSDVWRERPFPIIRHISEDGEAEFKLPVSASDEEIIQNARNLPMDVTFVDDESRIAIGNSLHGYRYYDDSGNEMPREEAEPFAIVHVKGADIVIRHGLLGVEVPEERTDENT